MVIALVVSLLVQAATPQVVDGVIVRPQWTRTPSAEDFAPPQRSDMPPNASVELLCRVGAAGAVTDCRVSSETPAGRGFRAVALGAARYFRHKPLLEDGRSAEGMPVRVTFRWTQGG